MSVCAILPNPYAHGLKNPALSSVQFCISPWNGYSRSHFKVKYTETELRPGAKELAAEIRLRPLSFIVDPQALQALFNIINWVEHIDRQIYEVSWTAPNAAGQYSVIFTSKNKEPMEMAYFKLPEPVRKFIESFNTYAVDHYVA